MDLEEELVFESAEQSSSYAQEGLVKGELPDSEEALQVDQVHISE